MIVWWKSTRSNPSGNCVEVGMEDVQWAKSTRSGGGECVEVGRAPSAPVLVRDTKDRDGGTVAFTPGAWTAFIDAVAGGMIGR